MFYGVPPKMYRIVRLVDGLLSLRALAPQTNDNSVIQTRMRPLSLKSTRALPMIETLNHLPEMTMSIVLPSTPATTPLETPVAAPAVEQHTTPSRTSKSAPLTRPSGVIEPLATTHPTFVASHVAMSFAFDAPSKSLNVVMTDALSGQVIRKFSYKSLPIELHRSDKLTGYLVDHNV